MWESRVGNARYFTDPHAIEFASGQLKQSFERREPSSEVQKQPRLRGADAPLPSAGSTLKNWFFEVVLLTLVVLIGIAVWQFYSLAWGETVNDGYTAGRSEPAYETTPAARTLPK